MALDFSSIQCLLDVTTPSSYITCFGDVTNNIIWTILIYTLLVIFVGGWTLLRPIEEGMMIGGFISTLISVGMWALETINVRTIMFPVLITLAGILLAVLKTSSKD